MIEIDIILVSKYVFPWRQEMICMSRALVLILAKSGIRPGINAWSVQLQLDDGGENTLKWAIYDD